MSYEALILQCALLHPHHITSFRGSLIIAYCSWTWLMDNGAQVLDNGANASASANARSRYHNGVMLWCMIYGEYICRCIVVYLYSSKINKWTLNIQLERALLRDPLPLNASFLLAETIASIRNSSSSGGGVEPHTTKGIQGGSKEEDPFPRKPPQGSKGWVA
ncbi:hypothetical protein F4815DRAFT_261774 [Daldinia loculata]|nr:hypothetical protein F4815DRAFT_261774 [Daldinia loculata]